MTDIISGEMSKKYIRLGVWLLRKKLGEAASAEQIKEDMENCGNPVFALLYQLLIETANQIEEGHQRNILIEIGGLMLWILYKDTAYKDVAIYMLDNILNDKDELKEMLKPYLKKPKDFYVNQWHYSKESTKKGKKKGEVGRYGKSFAEQHFVPRQYEKKKYK